MASPVEFGDIPKDKLVRLQARVHPGFKRQLEHRAADEGLTLEEIVHSLLLYALGDPGPLVPRRRPLFPVRTS